MGLPIVQKEVELGHPLFGGVEALKAPGWVAPLVPMLPASQGGT